MDYDNDDMNKDIEEDVDPFSNIQESNSPEKKKPVESHLEPEEESEISEK